MRKNTVLSLLSALALVLSMMGCEDTKARQENEQLKAHVAELVKEIGNLQSRVDELTQENAALKQENDIGIRVAEIEYKVLAIRGELVTPNQFRGEGRNLPSRTAADWLRPHIAHAIFGDGIQQSLSIMRKDRPR